VIAIVNNVVIIAASFPETKTQYQSGKN